MTSLIFPDSHLNVLSYNRCVKAAPAGMDPESLLRSISQNFHIEKMCARKLRVKHELEVEEYIRARGISLLPSPRVLRNDSSSPHANMKMRAQEDKRRSAKRFVSGDAASGSAAADTVFRVRGHTEAAHAPSEAAGVSKLRNGENKKPTDAAAAAAAAVDHLSESLVEHKYDICMYLAHK